MGWLDSYSYGDTGFTCAAFIQLDDRGWKVHGYLLRRFGSCFWLSSELPWFSFLVTSHHPIGQMMDFLTRQFQGSVLRKWKGKPVAIWTTPKVVLSFCHNLLVKASHETNVQVREMGKQISLLDGRETKVMLQRCRQTGTEFLCLGTGGKKAIYVIKTLKVLSSACTSFSGLRLIFLTANLTSNGCLKWTWTETGTLSFLLWNSFTHHLHYPN